MKYVVLFENNLGTEKSLRLSYLPLHVQFLQRNSGRIAAAGDLSDLHNNEAGGLWVVNAEDEAEVIDCVRADPYWPTGLRKSYRVMKWSQTLAEAINTPVSTPEFA